eukprot:TRINITY_DN9731_c0_g2_i1.p1 TRINITY_DN9731_c0_g2~~TRINITY_DN9731_c0_g2_i1.p1  ORF type:complete len:283 (-),score=41.50 TRINITY_DN9731_c0_g2_i1:181-1029(-)
MAHNSSNMQMTIKSSASLKCAPHPEVNSSEPRTNPDLLISGYTFLKGAHYSVEFDEPLPVRRPKLRYFAEADVKKALSSGCKASAELVGPAEKISDYSQIVCMRCGEMGHTVCNKGNSESIQIKWKPENDYRELSKKRKEAPPEEVRIKDGDDIEMNIACYLQTVVGNTKANSNRSVAIEDKFKKYKMRVKRSKRIYCCKCGDHHKFSQCPLRCENRVGLDGCLHIPSDSDESIITNETSTSDIKISLLNSKSVCKFSKLMNKNTIRQVNKWSNTRKKQCNK